MTTLARSLALWLLIASCSLAPGWSGRARAAEAPQPAAAFTLYFQGKSLAAREALEAWLASPEAEAPGARLAARGALLEICIHSLAQACLAPQASAFGAEAGQALTGEPEQRKAMARLAGYYIDAARHAVGSAKLDAEILQGWTWTIENPQESGDLYLRRQVLAGRIQVSLGRTLDATRTVDKILSLVAATKNPQDNAFTVAWALSETVAILLDTGDADRALRVYRAAGPMIAARLPPLSVDAVRWRLIESRVLEATGADVAARGALDQALAALDTIELEPEVRQRLLVEVLTGKAVLCAARMELDCAREALARHPFAAGFAAPGRAPASTDETVYLTARAVVAAFGQTPDPVVVQSLASPIAFDADRSTRDTLEVYRALGVALASPPGGARQAKLRVVGERVQAVARRDRAAPFGAWYRSGAFDQLIFQLALTQSGDERTSADVALTLHQVVSRRGRSFDADALTLLGQAEDAMQRRSIHQALRLRARRDSLEETALRASAQAAMGAGQGGRRLVYDWDLRRRLRDFSVRIASAGKSLPALSDVNIVSLKALQATLEPDEAVLTLAPAINTVAYMCVRRDSVRRVVRPLNLADHLIDIRLLQQALTAGHAPSEALDAQFPVGPATRLYDTLIRPFDPCLKPNDRIVWLPSLTLMPVPLSILLERAPPKAGAGYDLAAAPWLARNHAVTYAGAASTVVALRSGRHVPNAAFDFLGVGDPQIRPGRLGRLAALPETRAELERSARVFDAGKVLTGAQATEAGFRGEIGGAYRYLSFATHGLVRDEVEGLAEPALLFTPGSEADALDDGLLTASEIADLNLAARFVALSACNTANYDLGRMAQDLPALASAFATAGVPATLGTLWPVESKTGEQVTAATFERLHAGRGAGLALAEAQRAFLAAPPSRAHLHPRFWAPFVILGDGGDDTAEEPPALTLRRLETLTHGGGEVLRLQPDGDRMLARLVTPRDAAGRFGAGTRAATGGGEAWRRDEAGFGADGFLARLGDRVLVGGFSASEGQFSPRLQALDAASGTAVAEWGDGAAPKPRAILLDGAGIDTARAVFGVATLLQPGSAERPTVRVFETGPALEPKPLFTFEAPQGISLDNATFTPWNGALLVTFTARYALPPARRPQAEDDFDTPLCRNESVTWIELRDAATGALRAARALKGHVVAAAAVDSQGRALLGGAAEGACDAEARGVILALDKDLTPAVVYRDESLGASEVRALLSLSDGRLVIAANKDNVVDFRPLSPAGQPIDIHRLPLLYSAMLVVLDRNGRPSAPILVNAGSSVLATTLAATRQGEIQVGGAVGEAATILHLSQPVARPEARRAR